MSPRCPGWLPRILTASAVVGACLVLGLYTANVLALVRYPFDWSPDEGLNLDYGRRWMEAPETLYARTVSPFPSAYGPLLPALLAPVVWLSGEPLGPARLLALGWTALGAFAVFLLVRQVAPASLALASVALALAAFDLTFWHVLVRVDGLMIALWLLASVPLFAPGARGRGTLSARRIALATLLLLLACLGKPTAALHALPLVLARWWMDRRSAVKLWVALAVTAVLCVIVLQVATAGGFLWVARLWGTHAPLPGLRQLILAYVAERAWPLAALACVGLLAAGDRWRLALSDPAALLLLGCALVVPAMSKHGASWNYALPAVPALAVMAGRWLGLASAVGDPSAQARRAAAASFLVSTVALLLALTRTFPLPTLQDLRSARAFYGYVTSYVAAVGGPILATRPDLAYFLVHQPVEIEGSSYWHVAAAGVPGTEKVLARLRGAEYTLVVEMWPYPESYREAIHRSYSHAGGCNLGFYFGVLATHVFSRRDILRPLVPPPGAICGGPVPESPDPAGLDQAR